jgi:rhomboid protease GluP
MCPHCRAFITTKDRTCPYCNETVGPRAVQRDVSGLIGGFIPHARFNTILILAINFGLYIITSIYSMRSGAGGAMDIDPQTLVEFGAKYAPLIAMGQWWRLVTAGFLHGGLLHILIFGFYVSMVWNPAAPSVGASAALFGLIGAMIALGVRHRNPMGAAIRGMYIRWAVYGLIFSLIPGIDMAAHIGGIVAGFGVGYLAGAPGPEDSASEPIWRVAAWLCILVTVVSFVKMVLAFSRGA